MRWAVITEDAVRETENGFAIDLPVGSDLATAGAELKSLGETGRVRPGPADAVSLLIRMSRDGELVDDPTEVGLAALEATRAMIRTGRGSVEVELDGTDVLIAGVDALSDMIAPDADARRRRMSYEDALSSYRSTAAFFTKAASLLLGSAELMRHFGTDDEALAGALAALLHHSGRPLDRRTALQAWPAPGRHQPTVGFDVAPSELDQMLASAPGVAGSIGLGDASGFLVRDLPRTAIQLGLIPSLLRRFVNFAETAGTPEREILSSVGVELDNWVVGLG